MPNKKLNLGYKMNYSVSLKLDDSKSGLPAGLKCGTYGIRRIKIFGEEFRINIFENAEECIVDLRELEFIENESYEDIKRLSTYYNFSGKPVTLICNSVTSVYFINIIYN